MILYSHCRDNNDRVVAGITLVSDTQSNGTVVEFEDVIIHHKYDPVTTNNDIALIKLKTPLALNDDTIGSISLPPKPGCKYLKKKTIVVVTGWGTLKSGGKPYRIFPGSLYN